MPYIKDQIRRDFLDVREFYGALGNPRDAGELNFQISTMIDKYITKIGKTYTTLNAVVGVLECAKLEMYRRIAAPYENQKLEENGDVYTV